MRAFTPHDDGFVATRVNRDEALLVQSLASQVSVLLREGNANDPALVRMLPDAYPDDPASSAEFRRYTAAGLIERKVSNADIVIMTLADAIETGELLLDPQQAGAWLRTLTDIRLSLATRLGIENDDDEPEGDSVLQELYDWLGFVQNSLVEALDSGAADG